MAGSLENLVLLVMSEFYERSWLPKYVWECSVHRIDSIHQLLDRHGVVHTSRSMISKGALVIKSADERQDQSEIKHHNSLTTEFDCQANNTKPMNLLLLLLNVCWCNLSNRVKSWDGMLLRTDEIGKNVSLTLIAVFFGFAKKPLQWMNTVKGH